MTGDPRTETLTGYVVDVACIRKYCRTELADRARHHSRDCALMGHCVESGYGLIDEEGRLVLLDPEATRRVVAALSSGPEVGAKLRVDRREREGEMETVAVELVSGDVVQG